MVEIGFEKKLLDDITPRIGALRHAMSILVNKGLKKAEYHTIWRIRKNEVKECRNELVRDLRFGYRKKPQLKTRINTIAANQSYAGMLQDLSDLALMGQMNQEELKKIKYDMKKLDEAAALSAELSKILAFKTAEEDHSEELLIRDKALTYLKWAVDEVREHGKYLFGPESERRKGYISSYLARARKKHNRNKGQVKEEVKDGIDEGDNHITETAVQGP